MVLAIILLLTFVIVTVITDTSKSKSQSLEQTIELEDNKKVEINDKILNDYTTQYLIAKKFDIDTSIKESDNKDIDIYAEPKNKECDDSGFTAEEILDTTAVVLLRAEKKDNKVQGEHTYTLKVDDIQKKAKQLFGKEVELAEVQNKVKNGNIDVNVDINMNLIPYKVKKVVYNKTKKTYSIELEYVKYTEENYSANKIDYDESDIIATYELKVKLTQDASDKKKTNYTYVALQCK